MFVVYIGKRENRVVYKGPCAKRAFGISVTFERIGIFTYTEKKPSISSLI